MKKILFLLLFTISITSISTFVGCSDDDNYSQKLREYNELVKKLDVLNEKYKALNKEFIETSDSKKQEELKKQMNSIYNQMSDLGLKINKLKNELGLTSSITIKPSKQLGFIV